MKDNKALKIIIFICIILILCIIFGIVFVFSLSKKDTGDNWSDINSTVKSVDDFKSVQEIIEYSNSVYISEEKCKDEGYNLKYKVKFAHNLFENDKSNEKFFVTILNRISYLFKYKKNYILIDEENNIEIKVKCNGTKTIEVLINGEKNYFVKYENINNYKNSKAESFTDLQIKSEELSSIINDKWKYNKKTFGDIDSTFNGYDIYGDEGIEVKSANNKVCNIIFNSNYKGDVINGFDLKYEIEDVINKLGKPTFGNTDSYAIGYKTKDMYIFFVNENMQERGISIYRNDDEDYTKFEELLNGYLSSKKDLKTFMNELTYLWPDYYDYTYSENFLKIRYPSKGLKIEYGLGTENQIYIYDNYKLSDYTKKIMGTTKVKAELESSLYLDIEEERIQNKILIENMGDRVYEHDDEMVLITSSKYNYTYEENFNNEVKKVYFISKDKSKYYNKELNENVYKGFFINDDYFLYSIKNKGIYIYNVITDEKNTIEEGEEDFDLIKYSDHKLYYDDKSILLEEE